MPRPITHLCFALLCFFTLRSVRVGVGILWKGRIPFFVSHSFWHSLVPFWVSYIGLWFFTDNKPYTNTSHKSRKLWHNHFWIDTYCPQNYDVAKTVSYITYIMTIILPFLHYFISNFKYILFLKVMESSNLCSENNFFKLNIWLCVKTYQHLVKRIWQLVGSLNLLH